MSFISFLTYAQSQVVAVQLADGTGRRAYCNSYSVSTSGGTTTASLSQVVGTDYSSTNSGSGNPSLKSYPGDIIDVTKDGDGNYNISCKSSLSTCFTTYLVNRNIIQNEILLNDNKGTAVYADNITIVNSGGVNSASCNGNASSTILPGGVELSKTLQNSGPPSLNIPGIYTSTYDFGNGNYKVSCGALVAVCFSIMISKSPTNYPSW